MAAVQRRAAQPVRPRRRQLWWRGVGEEEVRRRAAEDGQHVDGDHQGSRRQGGHRRLRIRVRGDGVLFLRHGVPAIREFDPVFYTDHTSFHSLTRIIPLANHFSSPETKLTLMQEDVLRLVQISDDLRARRRERVRQIEWENKMPPAPEHHHHHLPHTPTRPMLPERPWDEERIVEREWYDRRPPMRPQIASPPPMPPPPPAPRERDRVVEKDRVVVIR